MALLQRVCWLSLAWKDIKTHYKRRKRGGVCVIRWREEPVCLAKLQWNQKHQKHYSTLEKPKIIHWGRCQPRYSVSDLAMPVERKSKTTGSFAANKLKEEILPEPFHVQTDSPKCFINWTSLKPSQLFLYRAEPLLVHDTCSRVCQHDQPWKCFQANGAAPPLLGSLPPAESLISHCFCFLNWSN